VPRILDLLDAEGLHVTFFVPGFEAEHHPDLMREILARGHEIAHHGYRHEYVWTLGPDEEREVFRRGLKALEDVTGRTPRGRTAPSSGRSTWRAIGSRRVRAAPAQKEAPDAHGRLLGRPEDGAGEALCHGAPALRRSRDGEPRAGVARRAVRAVQVHGDGRHR